MGGTCYGLTPRIYLGVGAGTTAYWARPSNCAESPKERIIEEIEEVGWDNVVSLQDGFRTVGIAVADEVRIAGPPVTI